MDRQRTNNLPEKVAGKEATDKRLVLVDQRVEAVSTVSDYIRFIKRKTEMAPNQDHVFFYRGQTRSKYDASEPDNASPKASIFRTGKNPKTDKGKLGKIFYEKKYYQEAMTRLPSEFEGLSSIDKLAKMQHYGWPTRLLDFSTSPLVALFFACNESAGDFSTPPPSRTLSSVEKVNPADGVVYFHNQQFPHKIGGEGILSYDSDRALLLGCLPRMTYREQKVMEFLSEHLLSRNLRIRGNITNGIDVLYKDIVDIMLDENKDVLEKVYDETQAHERLDFFYVNKVFTKFFSEVERERNSFASYNVNPEDLLNSFMVHPQIHKLKNERLLLQGGAFCITGLRSTTTPCRKVIIPNADKAHIIDELSVLGINKVTIYNDLPTIGEFVDSKVQRLLQY